METILNISNDESPVALAYYLDTCKSMGVPGDLSVKIVGIMGLWHGTRSGVLWSAAGILSELASEELSSCVSLNPLEAPQNALSVLDTLNDGDAVVYVPSLEPSTAAETAGRCIKTKFFEFAFQCANKVRPFFYIVYEAHRFISSGQQDGEQSLLDRRRAYRTGVVMATQSHASLAMRLEGSFGDRHALDIILNNCGNSLYFRTPDIHTQNNLRDRIPEAPIAGRMHVVKVRPLASLTTGSCYALQANEQWGIFKVRLGD